MTKSKKETNPASESPAWWLQSLSQFQIARANDAAGLTSAEARSRLAEFGANLLRDRQQQSLILQFLSRFKNSLVILLLVARAISAFTGEITNFVIITIMVLFSVTLDFVQEHRAGKAAESLRHSVSVKARVMRDGKPQDVPVTDVVPGDVALLAAGDMVPADGYWAITRRSPFLPLVHVHHNRGINQFRSISIFSLLPLLETASIIPIPSAITNPITAHAVPMLARTSIFQSAARIPHSNMM